MGCGPAAVTSGLQEKRLDGVSGRSAAISQGFPRQFARPERFRNGGGYVGNDDAAVKWFQQYVDRGLGSGSAQTGAGSLRPKASWTKSTNGFRKIPGRLASLQTVFRLSTPDLIAEDIAYDPGTQHFFISSMRQRKILRCEMPGKCADFVTRQSTTPLGGVLAVRADANRKFCGPPPRTCSRRSTIRRVRKGNRRS